MTSTKSPQSNPPKSPFASHSKKAHSDKPKESPSNILLHKNSKPIKKLKTKVIVKYDVGFNNKLTIRGTGANLSWEKGIDLKNINSNEWVWETDANFTECEFKVLINDTTYEIGDNHKITCHTTTEYKPNF